jgi:hypothetical protein
MASEASPSGSLADSRPKGGGRRGRSKDTFILHDLSESKKVGMLSGYLSRGPLEQ